MSLFWRAWMIVWLSGVMLFGLILAGAAFPASEASVVWLLETLQGQAGITPDAPLRFSLALMGCVSIGWAILMLWVMLMAFRGGEMAPSLWRGLTVSICVWFVIDSALSAATGFGLNVIPNTALLITYLIGVVGSGAYRSPTSSRTTHAMVRSTQ
jgi:hypothetical protein